MITEKEFLSLYDENISKKEYDRIIKLIEARVDEIIKKIHGKSLHYYIYPNGDLDSVTCGGYFDPKRSKEWVEVIVIGGKKEVNWIYGEDGFYASWLWTADEEWQKELEKDIKEYKKAQEDNKEKAKKKAEELKKTKAKFKKIISEKLTKEELKYIEFK